MITCFFNSVYVNADIERYYLGPALIAWTWLAILARTVVDLVASSLGASDDPGDRPVAAASSGRRRSSAALVAAVLLLAPTAAAFTTRATAVDETGDRGAAEWLDAVLTEVEPDAMIVSWWSYSTPLWYAQLIEDRRPDISSSMTGPASTRTWETSRP